MQRVGLPGLQFDKLKPFIVVRTPLVRQHVPEISRMDGISTASISAFHWLRPVSGRSLIELENQ